MSSEQTLEPTNWLRLDDDGREQIVLKALEAVTARMRELLAGQTEPA